MQDARLLAKKRLPTMIFDYVDGVALEADGYHSNAKYLKTLKLSQNVLAGGGSKKIYKRILGQSYDLPFGIAPMGMCNLVSSKADYAIGKLAKAADVTKPSRRSEQYAKTYFLNMLLDMCNGQRGK